MNNIIILLDREDLDAKILEFFKRSWQHINDLLLYRINTKEKVNNLIDSIDT